MSDSIRLQLNHLLFSSDAEYAANIATDANEDHITARNARDRHNIHIEQMATLTKTAVATDTTEELNDMLHEYEQARESDVKALCESDDNPLFDVMDQLALVDKRAKEIKATIGIVGQQMDRGSNQLIEKVSRYVHMKRTRVNIENSLSIVRLCLQALEHTNQVQELLKSNHRVAAVQNLQDLQSMELAGLKNIGMGTIISQSVKSLTKEITTSTLASLRDYLKSETLKKHIDEVGQRAYNLMQAQRNSWESIVKQRRHLKQFRLNSPVELAYRRSHENFLTETQLGVDLGPLYEAEMVFEKLGKTKELESYIESKLSRASDALAGSDLMQMLERLPTIVGFSLFDRTLSRYLPAVRPAKMVDDNWEKLAQNINGVIGSSLSSLEDYRSLKLQLSMLMDILHNFDFDVAIINDLFRTLVSRLSEQMVAKAKADFSRHWESGDQMQMVVTTPESYKYVRSVVWYNPNDYESNKTTKHGEEQLPLALPFSEIYVVICRHLRTLIDYGNSFLDHFQQDPGFVENTISRSIDMVLKDPVHSTLSRVANGSNRELIVQTLINLQLFYLASSEIEKLLAKMRGATGRRGTVILDSKSILEKDAKDMETRIYVILEEAVREFFETSTFDWLATETADAPSTAVLEMTTYLLTMANTVLKRLPPDVRLLAYFNLTENIGAGMRNIIYAAPQGITSVALDNFVQDLNFLETSISQLAVNSTPSDTLIEARQIVELLRSDDPYKQFSDPKIRNRQYGRISVVNASKLIAKVRKPPGSLPQSPELNDSPKQSQSGFMRYLSGDK